MTMQQIETYGDSRSPILAARQKMPGNPLLFLSIRAGTSPLAYVQVQIVNKITNNND